MALHHNLPPFFAVMDPASPLPSRYYVFMTYELDQSVIVVNNMKFSKPFIVWVGQTDETRPHTTKLRYYGLETEIMFWNTGIDIMSDENKLIPVLDFERDLFLPSPASNPSPVYVTPDTITSKNQNQTMIRERRTQMMDIIRNLYNDVRMTPPPPPATQADGVPVAPFPPAPKPPGFPSPHIPQLEVPRAPPDCCPPPWPEQVFVPAKPVVPPPIPPPMPPPIPLLL